MIYYRSADGSTSGRVSEKTLRDFLSSKHMFSNIDEFRNFHSKNKYIALFDADTLNQHIKIPNFILGFDKDDNLYAGRFK